MQIKSVVICRCWKQREISFLIFFLFTQFLIFLIENKTGKYFIKNCDLISFIKLMGKTDLGREDEVRKRSEYYDLLATSGQLLVSVNKI